MTIFFAYRTNITIFFSNSSINTSKLHKIVKPHVVVSCRGFNTTADNTHTLSEGSESVSSLMVTDKEGREGSATVQELDFYREKNKRRRGGAGWWWKRWRRRTEEMMWARVRRAFRFSYQIGQKINYFMIKLIFVKDFRFTLRGTSHICGGF